MQVRPISPAALVEELAERIAAAPPQVRTRVAIDGAPVAAPAQLADALAEQVRLRGRAATRVSAPDFLRPASLRLEHGREDPDAFYEDWLDVGALAREVLNPLEPGGTGAVLPSRWDPLTDRATRSPYVTVPPGGVVLLDGCLLLGRGLRFDLTAHLWLSPAALRRRTPEPDQWTLPAYARYEREADPGRVADVVVRADDPRHPALLLRRAAGGG